jgi:hypothetical protein
VYWKQKNIVWNRVQLDAFVTAMLSAGGYPGFGSAAEWILRTDGVRLLPSTPYASLVQPVFTGYGAVTPFTNILGNLGPNDLGMVNDIAVQWVCTATPSPGQVITGWAVVLPGTPTDWIFGEDFPAPGINIAAIGDFLKIDTYVPFPLTYAPVLS